MNELPSVLWAYRTTPQRSTGETPFSLAYGMDAVIPLEIGLPTIRTEAYSHENNKERIVEQLDMIEERRERALIKLTREHPTMMSHDHPRCHDLEVQNRVLITRTKNPGKDSINKGKNEMSKVRLKLTPITIHTISISTADFGIEGNLVGPTDRDFFLFDFETGDPPWDSPRREKGGKTLSNQQVELACPSSTH